MNVSNRCRTHSAYGAFGTGTGDSQSPATIMVESFVRRFPSLDALFHARMPVGSGSGKLRVAAEWAGMASSTFPSFGPCGQPRRWVVERFFAWINRNRRLAKDFEATIASARAFLYAASVMLLVRRLARAA